MSRSSDQKQEAPRRGGGGGGKPHPPGARWHPADTEVLPRRSSARSERRRRSRKQIVSEDNRGENFCFGLFSSRRGVLIIAPRRSRVWSTLELGGEEGVGGTARYGVTDGVFVTLVTEKPAIQAGRRVKTHASCSSLHCTCRA